MKLTKSHLRKLIKEEMEAMETLTRSEWEEEYFQDARSAFENAIDDLVMAQLRIKDLKRILNQANVRHAAYATFGESMVDSLLS